MADHSPIIPMPVSMYRGVALKFILLVMGFFLVPITVQGYDLFYSMRIQEEQLQADYHEKAKRLADNLLRLLKERYRDVLTYSQNGDFRNRTLHDWAGESRSPIVETFNRTVQASGDYYLILFVDTDGRLIAVNDLDSQGRPISTDELYQKNFGEAPWVQKLKARQEDGLSLDGQVERSPDSLTVAVERVGVDQDVKEVFPQENGLTIGLSAPVYEGKKVVGYYSHRMKFSAVETIFQKTYQEFKQAGLTGAELVLQDGEGFSLIEYAPAIQQTEDVLHDFDNILLKMNWARSGFQPAQLAVKGLSGASLHFHPGKQSMQFVGYSHLPEWRGLPETRWSVLVQIPEKQALSHLHERVKNGLLEIFLVLTMALVSGLVLGRKVVRPLRLFTETSEKVEGGDLTCRVPVMGSDEFGRAGQALNNMLDDLNVKLARTSRNAVGVPASSPGRNSGDQERMPVTLVQTASPPQVSDNVKELADSKGILTSTVFSATSLGGGFDQWVEGGEHAISPTQDLMSMSNREPDFSLGSSDDDQLSRSPGNMMDFLRPIAERTDVLAMNMAIETVRAGEQGRGLAVAAREIQALAQRTRKAVKEIASIIEAERAETSNSAGLGGTKIQETGSGFVMVRQVGIHLKDVINRVERVVDMLRPMVRTSRPRVGVEDRASSWVQDVRKASQKNEADLRGIERHGQKSVPLTGEREISREEGKIQGQLITPEECVSCEVN